MDGLELRIDQLESENSDLKIKLKKYKGAEEEEGYEDGDEDGAGDEESRIGSATGKGKDVEGSGTTTGLWQK